MRTSFTMLLALLFMVASNSLFSQTKSSLSSPWTNVSESILQNRQAERQIVPLKYRTYRLDVDAMRSLLEAAPLWMTNEARNQEVIMTLPMPDGSFQQFRVEYAPIMHPDLAARFPEIRSYAGQGIDDPTAYVRFDLSPKGFHAYVRSAKQNDVFIDPYSATDDEYYQVYFKKDFFKDSHWECTMHEVNEKHAHDTHAESFLMAGDCTLRTYRLALACTGEYATFHGGTVAGALAAMNTTMTRVNGIFEIDASITMQLVPNNSSLIFLNAGSDPYSNTNGSAMLSQNQTTCDNIIGSANYDIGHVFSTGGGGVAYLGSVCNNSLKAGGVTGQPSPVGDPFDVDYVSHEMGHQYGANHTQNNSCNRNNSTAMEPGSASTIMGYAGICSPNVQNNSDAYFHAISLQEMGNFTTGNGNSCSVNSNINDAPTANAGANYTIPQSTYFVLEGSGSDPNGDELSYCWEQMDNEVASMPPSSSSTSGPAFRSLEPTDSPDRYMPNLSAIIANQSPTWEVLPSVARNLDFRLTVRDNKPGGGCTEEDDMRVTVASNSGPFLVTAPNTSVSWPALSQQTVTWDVAGTTASPVSAANVDIFLSTDGGFTYPTTLATATPNDGSHTVTIPNAQTTQARIMVRGSGNIFFDISNQNFTISAPQNGFTVDVTPNAQTVCAPANAVYSVNVAATGSFSGNVNLSVTGVPAGASASFSTNPIATSGSSQMTISGTGAVAPGTYSLTVTGTSGSTAQSETVDLTILSGAPNGVTLSSPSNGATGVAATPDLTWSAASGADSYDVQVATDAGFSNLAINETGVTSNSFTATNSLNANTLHYWRVRAVNTCGTSAYSSVFTFTTANITCGTFASNNVPVAISSSGTPTVTSTLNIGVSGNIDDVNLNNLNISHTWINDLIITLTSPSGTQVTLINQICESEDNILTNLDDEASNSYSALPCPPTNNGVYQPFSPLSAFDGEEVNGTWTLSIQDVFNQDGGSLNAWGLEVCYGGASSTPLTVSASGTNVDCFGDNTGTASASATGGNGTYSYAWSNGGTSATITGLSAGTYTVTVTSGTESETASFTVSQPASAVSVSASGQNTTCGQANGSASAAANGGTPGYTYAWSNGANGASISGLSSGTYTVTATDANGCTATSSATVGGSSAISAAASATGASCFGGTDGTATASGSNGTAPYTYTWSNGGNSATISGLAAGTYGVTVTDANGCSATTSATVTSPSAITIDASVNNTSCGQNNGSATANANGGTPGYSYTWSNGGATATISNLAAGPYTVTVTDANGCTQSETVSVGNSGNLTASATGTGVDCFGGNNGTASASATGGATPYSYAWSNGGNTQTITGLSAGTYTVTITDPNGCADIASTTISQPASAVSVSASGQNTTCGQANGSASAAANGGTPGYTYAWSNGAIGASISGLSSGTYTVTATDANGCTATSSATVGGSSAISAAASATGVSCFGGNDGTATASGSNGTAPYTYTWSNGGNSATISGLAAGTYGVTISDANGCTATALTAVGSPSAVTVNVSGVDPNGGNNGSATASASGGTPGYSYAWSNGGNTASISNLGEGTYSVTATDANGCTATGSVTLTEQGGNPCTTIASTNVPIIISASGTPTVTSTIGVSGMSGTLNDVNVLNLDISHTWINDLIITLTSPSGTQVTLINQICNSEDNILTNLDDDGAAYGALPCPPTNNGTYQAFGSLSAFNGENPNGTWTMTITDVFNQDGGSLNAWSLELCTGTGGGGGCTTQVVDDWDFENGWGIWNDGGSDCRRSINDQAYAFSGQYCARLRDNTSSSVMTTDNLNLASFEELTVEFTYLVRSFDNSNEDFWLQVSTNGGASYQTVEEWNLNDEFQNNVREFDAVVIPGPFSANTRLRFRADASSNNDWVYIDDVLISGCSNSFQSNPIVETHDDDLVIQELEEEGDFVEEQILLFPNPTSKTVTMEFQQLAPGTAQIVVINLLGEVVLTENISGKTADFHQLKLDVSDLRAGQYFVQIIEDTERRSIRFVKI